MLHYATCIGCGGGPWPPHRFYKVAKRKDGTIRRNKKCKDCCIKAVRENYELKAEYYKKKKSEIAKRPENRAARAKYSQSPRGIEVMREARHVWRVLNPEKYKESQQRWWKVQAARRRKNRAEKKRERIIKSTTPIREVLHEHRSDGPSPALHDLLADVSGGIRSERRAAATEGSGTDATA